MPLKAPTSSKEFEIVPAGNHMARLYRIIHLGVIKGEYMGAEKEIDTIMLGFELPTETREFKEGEGQKPFAISQEYTLSMNEKANLRKFIAGMRGATFTEAEAADFDVLSLVGTTCLLNVVHKTSKAGKEYANIQGASPLPKGMEPMVPVNEPFLLDFDENWSQEKFDKQPKFIQDKIKGSRNYMQKFGQLDSFGEEIPNKDSSGIPYPAEEIDPEDIPF